jgi:hypothetical protein
MITSVQEYKHLVRQVKKLKDLGAPQEIIDRSEQKIKRLKYVLPDYCKEDKILYLHTIASDDSNITFITEHRNKGDVFIVDGLFKNNRQPTYKKINLSSVPRDIAKLLMSEKIENGWKIWFGQVKHSSNNKMKLSGNKKQRRLLLTKDKKNPNKRYMYKRGLIEDFREAFDLLDNVRIDLVQVNEIL